MRLSQADFARISARNSKMRVSSEPHKGLEKDLHNEIAEELRRRRVYFVHSRTDKATTQNLGVPDFICALPDGVTLWLEIKRKGGKLSEAQNIARHCLLALGHRWAVVYSFAEFLEAISASQKTA